MKMHTLLAAGAILLAAGTQCQAQSKTNGQDRTKESSGSNTLSPGSGSNQSGERPTNVSQTREQELQKENGVYQMEGERDWGTNAKMNGYPYPVVRPEEHPGKNIDTTGEQIQSGLYDNGGNASGDGAPVRTKIDQDEAARKRTGENATQQSKQTGRKAGPAR